MKRIECENKVFIGATMMILLGFVLILTLPYILTRNHGWFDFTETGQIGDTIGGITAPFIAVCSAYITFLAFWVQYTYNKKQKKDLFQERFENNLFYAETIANSINRLYVYGHNTQDASRIHTLIDEISKAALLMRQESSVCIAVYNNVIGDDRAMTNLVDNIQLLSAEFLTKANNVANNIAFFRQMFDKTQSEEGKNKNDAFAKAMMIGWQNNQLLDEPLKYKDSVNNDIEQYLLWLSRLYMGGLAINYKVELIHIGKDKQDKKSTNILNEI